MQHVLHAMDLQGTLRPEVCPDCQEIVAGWLTGWARGDQRSYVQRLRADIDEAIQRSHRRNAADAVVDLLTSGRVM